jgi:predicted enzyme related to lactoylglutathione lyase
MGSRWFGLVVDSRDPARLARWWAEVLGYRIMFEHPHQVAIARDAQSLPGLVFVPMAEPKAGRNRLHLDLDPEDQDAEIERLVDMGARPVESGPDVTDHRVTLADPEGNEFCVLRTQTARG